MFVDKDDRSILNKTMGSFRIFGLFLLFSSVVLIQCQITVNQDEINKVDSLPLILQFLNDDVKATINYNSGKIVHTQLKGDILEVDLLVSISCKKQSDQCNYESAECRGLLFAPSTGELQVLSVDCNPNTPIIEEPLALPVKAQPCTGCMTDINVNAEGVEHLVKSIIQHVESENGKQYTLLEVLRVQQQVVNGVNFYLTVKIAPTICNSDTMECNRDPKEEDIYCVVKFFQEPGFEAPKNIISNNCTHTQSFIPTMRKFDSNDINSVAPGSLKVMAHEKNVEVKKSERTENDILNELMSQIIPLDKFDTTSKKYVELVQSNPVTVVESSSLHNLLDENGQPIIVSSTFQDVVATEDQPISLGTDVAGEQVFTPNNSVLHQEDSSSLPSVDDSIRSSQSQVAESQGQTEMISESSSLLPGSETPINSINQERTKRSLLRGGKLPRNVDDPEIAEYLEETVNYMNNKLGGVENPLKINKVLSVTSQVVEGISYDIKVEIGSFCTNKENLLAQCRSSSKICDVNIWSRPWLNSRVTTVNCEREKLSFDALQSKEVRSKRSIPGGWSAVKNDDPRIKEHLGKVLTKVDSQTGSESALKIKEIVSASSQIVAGTNWDIKAKVVFPHCKKGVSECDKNSSEKICEFKFWEKLPDKNGIRELDNIKMNCDQEVGKKNKRETYLRKMKRSLVGGHNPLSSDDPRLTKHLEQLLPKLDSLSDKEHKLKVKKIISATTQVVAGTNWNIKAEVALSDCPKSNDKKSSNCGDNKEPFETVCTFEFWEKLPDKNGVRDLDNVKINCDEGKLNYRSKRSLLGGHNTVSNSDPRLNEHLEKLLPKLGGQSGRDHKFKVKEILSATSQVVAGTNWNIKAKLVLSDCLKSDPKKSTDCGENKDTSETTCVFKFWEKLPDKNGVRELDNINIICHEPELNSEDKREAVQRNVRSILVGGHNSLPNDDPRLAKHLDKLLPKLDTQTGQDRKLKIKEILSASSQVVAGTNWNIKAKVGLSDCLKTTEKKSSECNESKDSFEAICDFKFWEKLPDENGVRELANIQIDCNEPKLTYRSKREVLVRKTRARMGGNSPVPIDDPILQNHLAQLLPKLDIRSEEPYKLKAREIVSAVTQSVAGNDWNIKAIVVLSDCLKSDYKKARYCSELRDTFETICVFKFWEKLPNKDGLRELDNIKINCEIPKLNYRGKREVKRSLVGGYSPVSNDDSRLPKHLETLLPKLESESGNGRKLTVKEIISASSQVVAGTNWNIKARIAVLNKNSDSSETVCDFKFWEKLPDKNGVRKLDNIQINCEEPKLSYKSKRDLNSRIKRAILGGYNSVPTDDPKILNHLKTLLPRLDFQSGKAYKLKTKRILSASKQLVAGTNWKIKVAVVLSDCLKEEQKTPEECNENQENFEDVCTLKFWERLPDENGIRIIDNVQVSCDKTQSEKYDYHFHSEGFKQFERKYSKRYSSNNERLRRFSIYLENMDYIKQLNDNEQGTAKYGITQFADLTREEFSKTLGYRSDLRSENEVDFQEAEIPDVKLPDNFDWRDKNAVAEVKNQGSCGSCWAFSVTGNVEGQYAIKYGKLLEFSEQELVDCDKVDEGCNGGLMDNAYRQIEKLGGLEEEKDYPYEAEDEKCNFNKTMARVQLSGAVNISTDESDMAKWLVKNGPISIAINANAMQFYLGGVSHPWKFLCNPKSLDHGVLIVGFGTHTYPKFKKALPYWIVKNSWGKSWGEQGYYRVYRGDGTCGVNQTPSSAILK